VVVVVVSRFTMSGLPEHAERNATAARVNIVAPIFMMIPPRPARYSAGSVVVVVVVVFFSTLGAGKIFCITTFDTTS
jgi:hypothetical protein